MKLIKWKIRWRREKEDRGNHVPPLGDATQAQGLKWRTEHPRSRTTSSIMQPISWGYPTCNPSTTHTRISWDFCECHFQGLTPDLQIQILWKMIPRKWHFNKHPRCFWFIPRFGNSFGCSVKMQRSRWLCIFIYFVGIKFSVRTLKTF